MLFLVPGTALGATLTNGGLGQPARDSQKFSVAVCNTDTQTLTQSVPVVVTVGGQTVQTSSASPIAPGACAHTYVLYSALGMQPGQAYQVTVVIDPGHTVIGNTNNQATYMGVTIPTQVGVAGTPQIQQQTISQLASLLAALQNLINLLLRR